MFHPRSEAMEERLVLSTVPPVNLPHPYLRPLSYPASHPNTPILPFGAASKIATFIDPSARIIHGKHVIAGYKDYIGPYTTLSAVTGFVKIGNGSDIQANAAIISNPGGTANPTSSVVIGDNVSVGFGAVIEGPSTIGGFGAAGRTTEIGANAVIIDSTIQPGAIVSPQAHVGPGVTVPTGFRVLPGANVINNAQASNPALGMVVPVTSADLALAGQYVANGQALAAGYANLYQGNAATGVFGAAGPAAGTAGGINNGDLAVVEGAGAEPGSATVPFEPASGSPTFLAPLGQQQQGLLSNFPARVTGAVNFHQRAGDVVASLGRSDAILGDQGQPITFGSIARIGNAVTITSPLGTTSGTTAAGGPVTFGQNFVAGDNAVILGGQGFSVAIGDNVSIGSGAVVDRTSIGPNSTIGANSYIEGSTIPANTNVPAGTIEIGNKVIGSVQF
jgi:carbonic anhydrase/acetyltransferase-like protein (isoleucine patch superfamily)